MATKLPRLLRSTITNPLRLLDRWIAHTAAHSVVISENMRQIYLLDRGLPAEQVTMIRDWMNEESFKQLPSQSEARRKYKVPERAITFLYLGNIGPISGLESVIEAFKVASIPDAQFVIVGDGSIKEKCQRLAAALNAHEVIFLSDPDVANVPLLQSMADIFVLPLRKGAGMSSVPSKLMAYMLSGQPVLGFVDTESDSAIAIKEAGCGWIQEPGVVSTMATAIQRVASVSARERLDMGMRGRSYGLTNYSRANGVRRLAAVLKCAAEGPIRMNTDKQT